MILYGTVENYYVTNMYSCELKREKHMYKFFEKTKSETSTEMLVVHALNQNPVELIRRTDLPRFINVEIVSAWDKISTYEVYRKLLKSSQELFGKSDKGLCAYLAQGLVNTMYEAVVEIWTDECECTAYFGYDYKTSSGDFYEAEDVMNLILPYMYIYGWMEVESGFEYHVSININE